MYATLAHLNICFHQGPVCRLPCRLLACRTGHQLKAVSYRKRKKSRWCGKLCPWLFVRSAEGRCLRGKSNKLYRTGCKQYHEEVIFSFKWSILYGELNWSQQLIEMLSSVKLRNRNSRKRYFQKGMTAKKVT